MKQIAGVIALALAGAGCAAHADSGLDGSERMPAPASKPADTKAPASMRAPVDSDAPPPPDTMPSSAPNQPIAPNTPVLADPDPGCGDLCISEDELCFQFRTHGATNSVDDSSYAVPPGEEHVRFYFDAPWETGAVGTRVATMFDNQLILLRWQLLTTQSAHVAGYSEVVSSPSPNAGGALLATWSVGGGDLQMPDDIGLELPAKGSKLAVQWDYDNVTGDEQADRSAVQVCTVPAGARAHVASITYAGTEDLDGNAWTGGAGMPPHQMSTFSGTCDPLRSGVAASEPIHIVGFWPKMGRFGVRMQAIVHRLDGSAETVFETPFDYNHQVSFLQSYDLAPGETLTTQCDYDNTSDVGVPFGDTVDTETCYDLVIAWPAHALENPAPGSLLGIPNTCL